jgi:hypothetical protein
MQFPQTAAAIALNVEVSQALVSQSSMKAIAKR